MAKVFKKIAQIIQKFLVTRIYWPNFFPLLFCLGIVFSPQVRSSDTPISDEQLPLRNYPEAEISIRSITPFNVSEKLLIDEKSAENKIVTLENAVSDKATLKIIYSSYKALPPNGNWASWRQAIFSLAKSFGTGTFTTNLSLAPTPNWYGQTIARTSFEGVSEGEVVFVSASYIGQFKGGEKSWCLIAISRNSEKESESLLKQLTDSSAILRKTSPRNQ